MSVRADATFETGGCVRSGLGRIARARLIWRTMPAVLLVLSGWLLFPSSGQDDAHITCWPAFTLSEFGQILNYNGERVEQSSTLLQVLLVAVLRTLTGMDLVTLAKLTSIGGGVAAVLLVFSLMTRVGSHRDAFCAAALTALSAPLVYWSFSGMESSLVAATGAAFVLTSADYLARHRSGSLVKALLALSAFALVRPETPLLIVCFLGSVLTVGLLRAEHLDPSAQTRRGLVGRLIVLAVPGALVCGIIFAFRWAHFGDLFPQPVSAKVSGAWSETARNGWYYVKHHTLDAGRAIALVNLTILLGMCLTAVRQLAARRHNVYVVLPLLFAAGYLCTIILSGGDWMPGGRFLVHVLPVAIALLPMSLLGLKWRAAMLGALTASMLVLQVYVVMAFAARFSTSVPIWADIAGNRNESATEYSWFERHSRINMRDVELIGRLDAVVTSVSSHTQSPVVILSGQMGMVPYHIGRRHFGRVRFVDRHGLIERSLTGCALMRSFPRDTGGLVLSFEEYFENFAGLADACAQIRPDIVFDIGPFAKSGLQRFGYEPVYEQHGAVAASGTRFKGLPVSAEAFIAVDRSLFQHLEQARLSRGH